MPVQILKQQTYKDAIASVLANSEGQRAPWGVSLDTSTLTPDKFGNTFVPAGSLIVKLASGLGRVLPVSKAAADSDATAVIKVGNPGIYKVGDVLTKDGGAAVGTIASIDVSAGTITLGAAPTTALVAGDPVFAADATGTPEYLGMAVNRQCYNTKVGSGYGWQEDVAAYVSATVYKERLPYWSDAIAALFPEIHTVY